MYAVNLPVKNIQGLPEELRNDPRVHCKSNTRNAPVIRLIKRVSEPRDDGRKHAVDLTLGYVINNRYYSSEDFHRSFTRSGVPRLNLSADKNADQSKSDATGVSVQTPASLHTAEEEKKTDAKPAAKPRKNGRQRKVIPGAVPEAGVSYQFRERKDKRFDVYKVWSKYDPAVKNNSAYKTKLLGISAVRGDIRNLDPSASQIKRGIQRIQAQAASCIPSKSPYPADCSLLVAFIAVACGATSCQAIATYWETHLEELKKRFPDMPDKVPAHDTLNRMVKRIGEESGNPVLKAFFADYIESRLRMLKLEPSVPVRHLSLDGQAVRAARDENNRIPFSLNLYDSTLGLVLAHEFVGTKHNETVYAEDLILSQDLTDCIVTWDALNTVTKAASAVIKKGGDYCMPIKSNQPAFENEIRCLMNEAPADAVRSYVHPVELGHGRIEERSIRIMRASRLSKVFKEKWPGIEKGSIVRAYTLVEDKKTGAQSWVERFFATTINFDAPDAPEVIFHTIRSHWAVETMHWGLDVIYCQDRYQCTDSGFMMGISTLLKIVDFVVRKDLEFEKRLGATPQETTRPVHRMKMLDIDRALLAILRALCPLT